MQAVTEGETETLMKRVGEVDGMTTLSSQDKAYLLDLVGEEFSAGILGKYKDDFLASAVATNLQPPPASPPAGS